MRKYYISLSKRNGLHSWDLRIAASFFKKKSWTFLGKPGVVALLACCTRVWGEEGKKEVFAFLHPHGCKKEDTTLKFYGAPQKKERRGGGKRLFGFYAQEGEEKSKKGAGFKKKEIGFYASSFPFFFFSNPFFCCPFGWGGRSYWAPETAPINSKLSRVQENRRPRLLEHSTRLSTHFYL